MHLQHRNSHFDVQPRHCGTLGTKKAASQASVLGNAVQPIPTMVVFLWEGAHGPPQSDTVRLVMSCCLFVCLFVLCVCVCFEGGRELIALVVQ